MEESIQDIPIILDDASFQSVLCEGENPVSVMAQEVVPEKRKRGRPPAAPEPRRLKLLKARATGRRRRSQAQMLAMDGIPHFLDGKSVSKATLTN